MASVRPEANSARPSAARPIAPDPSLAIESRDLRIDYGDLIAVDALDLRVPKGAIYGLVGPNGAGKSSTIRVLATLQQPTYGDVYIGGIDIAEDVGAAHRLLGYMPDLAPLIPDLTIEEFLRYFDAAHGLPSASRNERIDQVLQQVGLGGKRKVFCKTLSRGMSQRAVLAKTLLHSPDVLLLDEPASGMDPLARIQLRDILRELASQGKTILLSSHILTELADICTQIGIMQKGRMISSGPVDEVVQQWSTPHRTVAISLIDPGDFERAQAIASELPSTDNVEGHGTELTVSMESDDEAQAELLRKLVLADIRITQFAAKQGSLEDVMRAIAPDGEVE